MQQVQLTIVDRKVTCPGDVCIDCTKDEYEFIIDADSEWANNQNRVAKMMLNGHFYCAEFVGDTCCVPKVKHSGVYEVYICSGKLSTVEPAMVSIVGTNAANDEPIPGDDVQCDCTTMVNLHTFEGDDSKAVVEFYNREEDTVMFVAVDREALLDVDVKSGELKLYSDDTYDGAKFRIDDRSGHLEVNDD